MSNDLDLDLDLNLLEECLSSTTPIVPTSTPISSLQQSIKNVVTQDKDTLNTIKRASWIWSHNIPVLITGQTGTGKELIARILHGNRTGKFVAINCGGIPDTLLEAEFFGAERGSYTGCDSTRIGYFEEANDGTIFLDEIAELPRTLQCKLLRVLQEREIRRIGGKKNIKINCRIVSATNFTELNKYEKLFRSDLYYRLAGTRFALKTLHERGQGEIDLIYNHFTKGEFGELPSHKCLPQYDWPGNVRELLNYCEELIAFKTFKLHV